MAPAVAPSGCTVPGCSAWDPTRIRTEVAAVLADEHFARAPQLSRLLRFLVDECLAGRAAELRESCLGRQVFRRGPSFDPKADAIVRVQAHNLRVRLHDYYARRPHDRRIDLRPGSYVPVIARPACGAEQPLGPEGAPLRAAACTLAAAVDGD